MKEGQTQAPYAILPPLSPEEYEALKADIAVHGVQVPVELDELGNILDGHHRVAICQELGIRDYPTIVRAGLSEDEKITHALRLNLLRRHLTREQRRDLVLDLRQRGWSLRRIAETLQVAHPTVLRDLAGAGGTNVPPDRVRGADGRSYPARRPSVVAKSAAERERALQALQIVPAEKLPAKMLDTHRLERLARYEQAAQRAYARLGDVQTAGVTLLRGDLRDRGIEIPDQSVDLILTDPPYAEEHLPLYSALGELAARVLKKDGLAVVYAGQMFLPEVLARLGEHLKYWWATALILDGDHARVHPRRIQVGYKLLLLYAPPDGTGPREWLHDLWRSERKWKPYHPWQQSAGVAEYYIRQLTSPGDVVLDPFLGTGTTGVEAVRLGRRFIGIELDPTTLALAEKNIATVLPGTSQNTTPA